MVHLQLPDGTAIHIEDEVMTDDVQAQISAVCLFYQEERLVTEQELTEEGDYIEVERIESYLPEEYKVDMSNDIKGLF